MALWAGRRQAERVRPTGGGRGGEGQAPARRTRPDVLGHMLAHGVVEHSCWGPGAGSPGPGALVRVLGESWGPSGWGHSALNHL